MTTKLTEELARRLEGADAEEMVPVIVTVRPGADVSQLEHHGLVIERRFESIPSIAGTLKAAEAGGLAALDQVELIEPDDRGVHAL
jgi:hypothetical protein